MALSSTVETNKDHEPDIAFAAIETVKTNFKDLPSNRDNYWIVDSGCLGHMSFKREWFNNLIEPDKEIEVKMGDY